MKTSKISNEEYRQFSEFRSNLVKEYRSQLKDSYLERAGKRDVKDAYFLDEFNTVAQKLFAGKYEVKPFKAPTNKKSTKRILNLYLSDLHFQALLNNKELPLTYGPEEEARRLAKVLLETLEYKIQHRSETELYVHIAGDIIQGKLHDVQSAAPLASQMCAAIHLLSQAISLLSTGFWKVTVFTTPGNHGRDKSRHVQRATSEKWDSHETVIYYAIKQAVSNIKNVEVKISMRPYYVFPLFGNKGFSTHGDTVIKPGNPNKTINVQAASKEINKINISHRPDYFSLFIVGHVHSLMSLMLPGKVQFMTNGCLIPPDGYSISEGFFDGTCGQWLWESTPDYCVGDTRKLIVDETTDKDKSLDKYIKPFVDITV